MLKRTILKQVEESIKHFPVTILSGPRQVGKSTLLYNYLIDRGYKYITLDDRNDRNDALNDPKAFLEQFDGPVIIDECQRAKVLFEEIEAIVNKTKLEKGDKKANGMFVLSGSSSKALLENAKESMAGRCNILKMNPLSIREILELEEEPFDINKTKSRKRAKDYSMNEDELLEYIVKGSMPKLYDDPTVNKDAFFSSYIETYMSKDLTEIMEIRNERAFNNFLTLLAANSGQELIYDSYAKNVGVKAPAIKQWVSALEKTGIIWFASSYNENSITKQIVKRPKLYFFDTGFACFLAGIRDAQTLKTSFLKGRFVETWIANEIRKTYMNFGINQPIQYYRDSNQNEIDLVILKDGRLMLIECKAGSNYNASDVSSFSCLDNTNYIKGENAIICLTSEPYSINKNTTALPISCI